MSLASILGFGDNSSTTETNTVNKTDYTNAPTALEDVDGSAAVSGSENVDISVTDGGAVKDALEFAGEAGEAGNKAVNKAFAFAGGAGKKALEAIDKANQEAIEAVDKSQDKAFEFSAGALDKTLASNEQAMKNLRDVTGLSIEKIMGATNNALSFGGGALKEAGELTRANTEDVLQFVDSTQEDYTEQVGSFSSAAIDKFVAASATESQQTTEKFMKYGTFMLAGVALIALGPRLAKAMK